MTGKIDGFRVLAVAMARTALKKPAQTAEEQVQFVADAIEQYHGSRMGVATEFCPQPAFDADIHKSRPHSFGNEYGELVVKRKRRCRDCGEEQVLGEVSIKGT